MLFTESQRFDQKWLRIISLVLPAVMLLAVYQEIIRGEPLGEELLPAAWLMGAAASIMVLSILLFIARLDLTLKEDELELRVSPFFVKRIPWAAIEQAEVVQHPFIAGWGIRFWTRFGTAFTMGGNKGLFIRLNNGKKYLIGSRKAYDLARTLDKLKGAP